MGEIGIAAYGSLIGEPGKELSALLVKRIPTMTPFPVEYGRLSKTRGGAPTVVPHQTGKPVKAEILVLRETVTLEEARNLLWRRETRNEGTGRNYVESSSSNAVVIRDVPGFCGLEHVLYTDFNPNGKLDKPDPNALALAAIRSVGEAPLGKDGISYLADLVGCGVETALTRRYVDRILFLTGAPDLGGALRFARSQSK